MIARRDIAGAVTAVIVFVLLMTAVVPSVPSDEGYGPAMIASGASFYRVTFTESDTGHSQFVDVQNGFSCMLPQPKGWEGHTFAGWYSDVGCTVYVGLAGMYYTPTSSVTLYAKYTSDSGYTVTASKTLDGASDSLAGKGTYTVPAEVARDGVAYMTASPASGYTVRVSADNAYIEPLSDAMYVIVPIGGDITVHIDVMTAMQGIGDFSVSAILSDDDLEGASVRLTQANDMGLMEGNVHIGGVYYVTMGTGVSAVRAYGAIDDTMLSLDGTPLTSSGISVDDGQGSVDVQLFLPDGYGIYHIHSVYTYTGGSVRTVAVGGDNVPIE